MSEVARILEHFKIVDLYGYKTVSLDFNSDVRVIVAENGSGKTTILNALNAVISQRFGRLSGITFDRIELKLSGADREIVLRKDQLSSMPEDGSEQLDQLAAEADVDREELLDFIRNTYIKGAYFQFQHHRMVHELYVNTHHDHESLSGLLDTLHDVNTWSSEPAIKEAQEQISRAFKDIEIVYLPTYRRIELPLIRYGRGRPSAARTRLSRMPRPRNPLLELDKHNINFGLSDVEARLAQLTEEIERRSNFEYRSISALIIDEILRDQVERESRTNQDLPDIDSLARFLTRVSRNRSDDLNLDFIRRLYETGEINSESKSLLRYFLGRLNRVISRTRVIEQKLQRFVAVSNDYLKSSSDEKELSYNPQSMKVVVRNLWTKKEVLLDDLSSGEKQIVSLMARLYLSEAKKFVLIDEPELSLSIDWQRRILPDVMSSETVVQLLAITHSPFVFENALDGVAGPLTVVRTPKL